MKSTKKSPKQVQTKNLYLTVYHLIKSGLNPSKISEKLGLRKTNISYYTRRLKADGLIEQIGYGTWKVIKELKKKKYKFRRDTHSDNIKYSMDNIHSTRLHYVRFKVRIKKEHTISNFKKALDFLKIKYKIIRYGKNLQFKFDNFTIEVCKNSMIIQFRKMEFLAHKPAQAYKKATDALVKLLRRLERTFKTSFKINKKYHFIMTQSHIALLNSPVARWIYDQIGNFRVKDHKGEWLVIDASLGYPEFEITRAGLEGVEIAEYFHHFFDVMNDMRPDPVKLFIHASNLRTQQ